jgi:hypothetical protein
MRKTWLLAALFAAAAPGAAHEWYPLECCHAVDCAPVDKVEIVALSPFADVHAANTEAAPSLPGSMLVTTKHGTVLVPANFPRRESKDNRMHACMRPGDGGAMRLICIFLPPAM